MEFVMRLRGYARIALPCLTVAALGCGDEHRLVSPELVATSANTESETAGPMRRTWTLDDEFARVAREDIPGFAGRYIDSLGRDVVLVARRESSSRAVEYIERLRWAEGLPSAPPIVRIVRYDAEQLLQWHRLALRLLAHGLVHTVDSDEVNNRISLETTVENVVLAREAALHAGIPNEALSVTVTRPDEPMLSLQSRVRPVMAGFQIENDKGQSCTIGIFATEWTGSHVFLTASHCSSFPYIDAGFYYYQPTKGTGNHFGRGLRDRDAYACDSTYEGNCRWSDTHVAHLGPWDTVAYLSGRVPATTGINSVYANYYNTGWDIIGERYRREIVVGKPLVRLGSVTGWQYGYVRETCASTSQSVPETIGHITLRCQVKVSSSTPARGDSGGGVFWRSKTDPVALWAGIAHSQAFFADGASGYTFSPVDGIEADLGGFTPW